LDLQNFRGEVLVNINLEVPDEIHKKIKILSATQGVPIKELIVKTLEESVSNEK
jgi:predicted HicB family RNase H-like nuclease